MRRIDFGEGFIWGTATSSYQIEGAWNEDGKGPSIWDTFTKQKGKIKDGTNGNVACDFYHRYESDLDLMRAVGFDSFRFSVSWPRIFPSGTGPINQKGLDFYNRLIDACLARGIEPWLTLYHWDLPQVLEDKGGWTNRDIVQWFGDYAETCAKAFGDRVKKWMIFNEPTTFVTLGYALGIHAPGKRSLNTFLRAAHHANLAVAQGGRVVKALVAPDAEVGTTNYTSQIVPYNQSSWDIGAAARLDALINRAYLEPILGLGYPTDAVTAFKQIEQFQKPEDEKNVMFDFDFWGLQNYTRVVAVFTPLLPYVWGREVLAKNRNVPADRITDMGWEVVPENIYEMLKRYKNYDDNPKAVYKVKKIYVTENGAAFVDTVDQSGDAPKVRDPLRTKYLQDYLAQVLKAKEEGVNIAGYFVWSFLDNFEWNEGYRPRFGITYVDYSTQQRILKDSALWMQEFLRDAAPILG